MIYCLGITILALIKLTYDSYVERQFYVWGRYPVELMDRISAIKVEIYKNLIEDLRRPDMSSGSREFEVQGRKFTVLFASDTRQNSNHAADIRPLTVMDVQEHS